MGQVGGLQFMISYSHDKGFGSVKWVEEEGGESIAAAIH